MNRYTTVNKVGEGTYGTVWKCVEKTTGQAVAIKRLKNPLYDRYHCEITVREIKMLRTLSNIHVVSMIEAFRHRGFVYMVFPYMRCNLYMYLELNDGVLSMEKTKVCMYQVSKNIIQRVQHEIWL